MSIISSNHIDLKSMSIWGLYKYSAELYTCWSHLVDELDAINMINTQKNVDAIALLPDSTAEYIPGGNLVLKELEISINFKKPTSQSTAYKLIQSDKSFIFIPGQTTIVDIQRFIYAEIKRYLDELNRDVGPEDVFLYKNYEPKDYIKTEQ